MFPLFESIKILDGKWHNLNLHEDRIEQSIRKLYHKKKRFNLRDEILVPTQYLDGLFKCKVEYNSNRLKFHFTPYHSKEIKTLQIVDIKSRFNYKMKWTDRKELNDYYQQRNDCDDILMVKDRMVLDSSYANIVFKDHHGWWTPKQTLLNGTQRRFFVEAGYVKESEIGIDDLSQYHSFTLINAMNDIGDMGIHPVSNIFR